MADKDDFFQPIDEKMNEENKRKIPDISFTDLGDIESPNAFFSLQKDNSESDVDNDTKVEIPLEERIKNVKIGLNNPKKKKEIFKKLVLIDKQNYELIRRLALFDIKSENQIINEALLLYLKKRKKDVNQIKDIS